MKRIYDPSFKYVDSNATDISVRFRRVRRELAKAKLATDAKAEQEAESRAPVLTMKRQRT